MKPLKDGFFPDNVPSPSPSPSPSPITRNSIKISKKEFKPNKTNVGWSLNADTVNKIKECAFNSNMTIIEFVQELLDKALEDIEIE
jgi:hypothetical protein